MKEKEKEQKNKKCYYMIYVVYVRLSGANKSCDVIPLRGFARIK